MNRVIERNGFKVVTLLRLSPLLPLAVSNYLYGVTDVSLLSYVFGTWLGMLPGTIVIVSAGRVSKTAFLKGENLPLQWWQVAVAFALSVVAILYISSLATAALRELEQEEDELCHTQSGDAGGEDCIGCGKTIVQLDDGGITGRHGGMVLERSAFDEEDNIFALWVVSGSRDLDPLKPSSGEIRHLAY